MKVSYIVALLMIVLMVGCATKQEAAPSAPAAPPAVPETPPAAPSAPAEEAAPAEQAPAEAAQPELTEAQLADIERLKGPCERGNAGLCAALKTRYGIDWPPAAEEQEAAEEPDTVESTGEQT